jgi:chromate transporter
VHAGIGLVPDSWQRRRSSIRWLGYLVAGGIAAATVGPWLVLVLLGCGLLELATRLDLRSRAVSAMPLPLMTVSGVAATGGLLALCWVAIKVGALSYGGGFVIIPLMQHDAVDHYHWMSAPQFLNAVALGQITPGPVVQTVAVVGYAAAGVGGGFLAALIAFSPSFAFVLLGARHFDQIRQNTRAQSFLGGAGPAAIGAILGTAVPLTRALGETWQFAVLAGAGLLLLGFRRGVVSTLLLAALTGTLIAVAGGPLPH